MIKTYRDLIAWQRAIEFSVAIYKITKTFPADEKFGLVSQLRRAAVSIPSNIAEGYALRGSGNYIRSLRIALGSLNEVQTQLEIAARTDLLPGSDFQTLQEQSRELERILTGLIRSIENIKKNNLCPSAA